MKIPRGTIPHDNSSWCSLKPLNLLPGSSQSLKPLPRLSQKSSSNPLPDPLPQFFPMPTMTTCMHLVKAPYSLVYNAAVKTTKDSPAVAANVSSRISRPPYFPQSAQSNQSCMHTCPYVFQSHFLLQSFRLIYSEGNIKINLQFSSPDMPGIEGVAFLILEYQLVMVLLQVVFYW